MHGNVRDGKEGASNFIKCPPAYSKLSVRCFGVWRRVPWYMGTFRTNLLPHSPTL